MTEALEAHLRRQIDHSSKFFWHRLRWRAVRSYLPEDAFALVDVGAGAGLLAEFLRRERPDSTYMFVEPIDSLRTFLRERYGAGADAGDVPDYHSARVVTLLDVLEHQRDDKEFLAGLVAKMAPGSTLLVTVPAHQRLWSGWDELLGHHRRYDKKTLLASTENLPLQILEMSFLFPEMLPLGMWRTRRKAGTPAYDGFEDAALPEIPDFMNTALYGMGLASLALRRHWPTGTSLFMAATINA